MWIRYVIPGLDAYMSHPIKQHYLLGNLPRAIRSNLLAKRKFLFTLYETAQRLCFMGLLQFGPQRLKEKDQV
jgi:general transcription factor 3C polypeptide 1